MERLSRLSTDGSAIRRARADTDGHVSHKATEARKELALRYHGPAYAYFLRLVGRQDAEDLRQDFALKFLSGDLVKAELRRPKDYRNYIKKTIRHMAINHLKKRRPVLDDEAIRRAVDLHKTEADWLFRNGELERLKELAWKGLEAAEAETRRPLHTVLWHRANVDPKPAWEDSKTFLDTSLGEPRTVDSYKNLLRDAKLLWQERFIRELADPFPDATREDIEGELRVLGMLDQVRPALDRLVRSGRYSGARPFDPARTSVA